MTQVFKSHVGFAKESVWGTIVSPTVWIPCLSYGYDEERKRELDKGGRAKAALDYGAYAGVQWGKPSYEWNYYPDECARWYARILGQDAISGVGPYVHTMTLADKGASDTISDFYGTANKERRFAGAYVESIDTKFDTKSGFVTQKVGFIGQAPDAGVAETTPTFPTDAPMLGWNASLKIATVTTVRLLNFELSLKRTVDPIFGANNSQTPTAAEVYPLEVTGKCKFYADTLDTEYGYFTAGATQNVFDLTVTRDATGILEFIITKFLWEKVAILRQMPGYVEAEATFRGIFNSTDAGPLQVIATNNTTPAY